ncbi:hypothetical protein HDU67_009561 [Dinochytrium kinnereticum]|nr:hypothetical protein HDU67_009561 [Dinochytrium kinnereticum]
MPKGNVDAAMKKGLATIGVGDKSGPQEELESVVYEGLTSYGVAVVVQALTSNRGKTFAEIRHCFTKNGGSLTPVLYLFTKSGRLLITSGNTTHDIEKLTEAALECDAVEGFEEVNLGDSEDPGGEALEVFCPTTDVLKVQAYFADRSYEVKELDPVAFIPVNRVKLNENSTDFQKLIDDMENIDEVVKLACIGESIQLPYRPQSHNPKVVFPDTVQPKHAEAEAQQRPNHLDMGHCSVGIHQEDVREQRPQAAEQRQHRQLNPPKQEEGMSMEGKGDPIQFFRSINQTLRENFSPARRKPRERAHLVQKFQRAWDSIIVDFQVGPSLLLDRMRMNECRETHRSYPQTEGNWGKHVGDTDIVKNLHNMVDILLKERAISDGGVEPGGCTELFLNDDMMATLVKISENDVPNGFRGEVIRFLNHLISVLDPNLMIQNAIHRPTLSLIRASSGDKEGTYEDDLVELEYDISAKIHEHNELLYIFFSRTHVPRNVPRESFAAGQAFTSPSPSKNGTPEIELPDPGPDKSVARVAEYEFALFDHLLRYIHLEGHRGDFAREACLFLIELASGDLETYICKTDFASSAIGGLGGLYSQLPPTLPQGVVWGEAIRGNSGAQNRRNALESFRDDMEAFLRLLRFVQGILLRCPSSKITKAILKDLKETFLENIVQSSITNSSDFDGTTVAVLFYIHQMLMAIQEDELSALFSSFLLSGDEDEEDTSTNGGDRSHAGSTDGGEMILGLRDILISKLNSLSEEVVSATLTVFQNLLAFHSHHALHLFIERLPIPKVGYAKNPKFLWGEMPSSAGKAKMELRDLIATDIHDHLFLVSRYFALVPLEASTLPIEEGSLMNVAAYPDEATLGAYLTEAESFIRSHLVRHRKAQAAPPVINSRGSSLPTYSEEISNGFPSQNSLRHASPADNSVGGLLPVSSPVRDAMIELSRDTTLRKLLTKFSNFFGHSFEINIALTGVLAQLASAPLPLLYMYLFASDILLGPSFPSLHTIIVRLRREVEERRATLPTFENTLTKTRQQLFSNADTPASTPQDMWPWRRKETSQYNNTRNMGEIDLDAEFLKNVVVLEEAIKELLSILVVHGSRDYDQIVYL